MMSKSSFCTFFLLFLFFFFLLLLQHLQRVQKIGRYLYPRRDIKDSVALLKTREIPPCRRPGPHRFGRSFPPRPDTRRRRDENATDESPPSTTPFSLGGEENVRPKKATRPTERGVPARGDFDDEKTTVDDVTKTLREESRSHPTFYPSERLGDRVMYAATCLNSRGARRVSNEER